MNKIAGLILVIATIILVSRQVNMAELDCAAIPDPPIAVHLETPEPVLDKSRSTAQIQALYGRYAGHKTLASNASTPAAAIADIKTAFSFQQAQRSKSFSGEVCIIPQRVDVNVTMNQTVYINRKSYADSCEFKAALDHEMKHVFVNRDLLKENLYLVEAHVENGFRQFRKKYGYGPFPKKEAAKIRETLGQYIEAAISLAMNDINDIIGREQGRVDTRQEYERVWALCDW